MVTATGPTAPLSSAGATTFRERYALPESDPYEGDYTAVMQVFEVPANGGGYTPANVQTQVLAADPKAANAYVGLFEYPGEPEGRTRLLHAPTAFPPVMGRPTPHDRQLYCFVDDVISGTAVTCCFPTGSFHQAGGTGLVVPLKLADIVANFSADPTRTLVGPYAAGDEETDTTAVRVPFMMFVPPKYVDLFMGRRLTPREVIEQVAVQVENDGNATTMLAFMRWCLAAATIATTGDVHSPVQRPDVTMPVADTLLWEWRQDCLFQMLPGLVGAGHTAAATATVKIASLMGDVLTEQRNTRRDAAAARAVATAPKTVSEHFKPHHTHKLLVLCEVASESDLPDLWTELAGVGGKRDRETIEMVVRQVANAVGLPELAPVITPSLAKKISTLRLAGTNLDDLNEGVQPFVIVIMDHTTTSGEVAYQEALSAAHDYDDVIQGAATDLADLKQLKQTTKVLIPETFQLARAMLQAYRILLIALLGEAHSQVVLYTSFLQAYTNRENFFMGRIQRADAKLGPARLLRFVQLHMRAWLSAMWEAPTAAAATAVPSINLMSATRKMQLGDMTWLPELPARYLKEPEGGSGGAPSSTKVSPGLTGKATQVRNTKANARFDDFKGAIGNTKFNDVIRKVGHPPMVKRNGKDVPMCASYHLRGMCFSNCSRKADHSDHTAEEDQALYDWCKLAFE